MKKTSEMNISNKSMESQIEILKPETPARAKSKATSQKNILSSIPKNLYFFVFSSKFIFVFDAKVTSIFTCEFKAL